MTIARIVPCPQCGGRTKTTPDNQWRPFCSERCKLIDLGQWFAKEHRIADEPADEDVVETGESSSARNSESR